MLDRVRVGMHVMTSGASPTTVILLNFRKQGLCREVCGFRFKARVIRVRVSVRVWVWVWLKVRVTVRVGVWG
jgi:hypothetical protein